MPVLRTCILVAHLLLQQALGLRTFTLEELVPSRAELFPERLSVQWVSETAYVYTESGEGIKKYDASYNTTATLLEDYELSNLGNYGASSFSKDEKYLLLVSNRKKVYRYSSIAEYAVYDLEHKSISKIGQGPLQLVVWGGGRSLAYVQKNNVYYVPDAKSPSGVIQLTTEGKPGEVYFGVNDWIYEEEIFNAAEGLWFSPGGTYLAVASFNDTAVESATFPYYGNPSDINNQYPTMVQFKYPKAGRTNPNVGLQVYRLGFLHGDPKNIPAPVDVVGLDFILGRVSWATEKNIIVLWLNRRQNVSVLINCNLEKDQCSIVKEQSEANGWIDISEPFFDSTGTKMVELQPMYGENQRFVHVSRFDFITFNTEDLSPGNSTVTQLLGWNEMTDTVYFTKAPEKAPWQRQIWASSKGALTCITCKESFCPHAVAAFSPGAKFGVISCSSFNDPPKWYLLDTQSNNFKLLLDNSKLRSKLLQYRMPMALYNIMPLDEHNSLMSHVKLLLPPEIEPGRKYPMIVRVYAGPGTSRVSNNFELDYNTYLTTNRSMIVASIDVRGSPLMGVEAMHAINNALGTYEVTDTLDAIRSLIQLHPFIDPHRIGVWGWSYGGFTTTMMLIQDLSSTITCGAAVAPVTSWLYYDSIYTERYMDTPKNNPIGYKRSDLMLQAERLRGKKYMLVHGSGDDNVHYQNSMQLAKRLQHADIAFEQMSYTDENHSLLGVSRHFYHTLDRFWTECFA